MPTAAPSVYWEPLRKGVLLAAHPDLIDPHFSRSVVLLCEHDAEGSVGFIVNRPTDFLISDVLPDFPRLKLRLYQGGPVNAEQLFYVVRGRPTTDVAPLEARLTISNQLSWGANRTFIEQLHEKESNRQKNIRFLLGYAGWSPGQLHQECLERNWYVLEHWETEWLFAAVDGLWEKSVEAVFQRESKLIRAARPELN
ncbi:hypothetical protein GC167_04310 [bacterium]|nr:hypothetical protein [bacterium]